jgi:retinol dehydrogenase-14
MEGKYVLLTGASSGVGLAMALGLAKLGATLLLVSRDPDRSRAAGEQVARVARGPIPTLFLADLSSQKEIRRLAAEVGARFPRIDVVINDAGAAFRRRALTVDGIERTFATNHLAPFLLTNLLIDRVKAAPQGRVITVTASIHSGSIDFDDLQLERGYGVMRAYAHSKLGNILFTNELARRLEGTNVTANSFCPGPTASEFGVRVGGFMRFLQGFVSAVGILHSAEVGASTGVYLASSPDVARVTGRYFRNQKIDRSKAITLETAIAARMWEESARLCGLEEGESLPAMTNGAA